MIKMKQNLIVLAFLLICSLTQAANVKGNGNIVTKDIQVDQYEKIELSVSQTNMNSGFWGNTSKKNPVFNYTQTNEKSTLRVTTDENLFTHLDIECSNGVLVIKTAKNSKIAPTQLLIDGTSKGLKYLQVSGGANFLVQGALIGENLEILASGGSDVFMKYSVRLTETVIKLSGGSDLIADDLVTEKLKVSISGGADAKLKGAADQAKYSASGGADIKAYGLVVKRLECSASGGADIEAHATETIRASASGGADIYYKGEAVAEVSKSGGGSVKKR